MGVIKFNSNDLSVIRVKTGGNIIHKRKKMSANLDGDTIVVKQQSVNVIRQLGTERIQVNSVKREYIKNFCSGPQGPPGATGTPFIKVSFAYNTPSPLLIISAVPGDCILQAELVITEAFDDPAATLSLGTSADNERIIAQADNDPTKERNFGSDENHIFTLNEWIRLYINPAAAMAGAGYVQLTKLGA